jgi:hypothetical protein
VSTFERVVTTQDELDQAIADRAWRIEIRSDRGVWITVRAFSESTVAACGESTVTAHGNSTVMAHDKSTVAAHDESTVMAYDESTVMAYDESTVMAFSKSTVMAHDKSTVMAHGNSTVTAYDESTVMAHDESTVMAYDESTVMAHDESTVRAFSKSTVMAHDKSTVTAYDESTVRACGESTVMAYSESTVTAWSHTAVHLHSGGARIDGGVLIDHTTLDESVPSVWAAYHGAQITGDTVTVYKAVRADLESAHGTLYEIGSEVSCDDWLDTDECGNGLHFSPSPAQASDYDSQATRWLECTVALSDLRPLTDGDTAKAKAPRAVVVREVDIAGRALSSSSFCGGDTVSDPSRSAEIAATETTP